MYLGLVGEEVRSGGLDQSYSLIGISLSWGRDLGLGLSFSLILSQFVAAEEERRRNLVMVLGADFKEKDRRDAPLPEYSASVSWSQSLSSPD